MNTDILVVGGGVVGLACAVLLAREPGVRERGLRITVLERRPPAGPPVEVGLRVFAISPASQAILRAADGWQNLPADRIAPYRRMVVWQGESGPQPGMTLEFDAAETGATDLGAIVEQDWLRWLLWRAAEREAMVDFSTVAEPVSLDIGTEAAELACTAGTTLRARLVIGADGARSWVRQQLRLPVSGRSYAQQGIVAHLDGERPHGDTAFQAFLPQGPVALLPLADGRSSLVWSCTDELAQELLALDERAFEARLSAVMGAARGALSLTTPRVAFPLAASHTHRYTGPRFALIGDAAHQVHPLAGQGANLGLLDAAALAETVGQHLAASRHADPGDALALRRYERWRKGDNLLTLATMDALHRLFTTTSPLVRRAGAIGLGAVGRSALLRRGLAAQAMGRSGELPRSARGS